MEATKGEPLRVQAARELLRRRKARASLLDFCQYIKRDYEAPKHLRALIQYLEAVERGEITRLMVSMPPRHGKSLTVSQLFPCWYLGRHPSAQVVQSGYSHGITLEHSRKARDLFVLPEMQTLFPGVRHAPGRHGQDIIATERQAANEWGTIQAGRYYAVGVGGGLTGRGADLAIIDDPVKNREDANSEIIRTKTWEWYASTLYTRLSPNGAIILVMTRWHPEDLAGKLLEEAQEKTGDHWEPVIMPAIDADGEALWPERWPLERLHQVNAAIGQREWSALYLQEPVVAGGNLFNVTRIQTHNDQQMFPDTRFVRFWDLASTEKEVARDNPDFTVGALVGVTQEQGEYGLLPHIWIKDIVAGQWEAPKRNQNIIATAERDGPGVPVLCESVAGYKDTWATLKDILQGKRTVKKITVSGDKVVRAAPMEPVFEAGNVHILKAAWNDLFFKHFTEFPAGTHDDVVDAVSGGYNYLCKEMNLGNRFTSNAFEGIGVFSSGSAGRNPNDYARRALGLK